jgi:hypothetical protein
MTEFSSEKQKEFLISSVKDAILGIRSLTPLGMTGF